MLLWVWVRIKPKLKVNSSGQFWQNYAVLLLFWSCTGEQISLLSQNSREFWGTLAEFWFLSPHWPGPKNRTWSLALISHWSVVTRARGNQITILIHGWSYFSLQARYCAVSSLLSTYILVGDAACAKLEAIDGLYCLVFLMLLRLECNSAFSIQRKCLRIRDFPLPIPTLLAPLMHIFWLVPFFFKIFLQSFHHFSKQLFFR